MRNVKFRAWDEEEKRFWYFTLQGILERRMSYRGSWDEKILRGEKTKYTGLKDKNGKEIYEGDILSFKEIFYTDCSKKKIKKIMDEALISIISYHPIASVVKVHKGKIRAFGWDYEEKQGLVLELRSEDLEVVGNIYENPEYI